ncbi:fibronectin type III domain-containing protein, partial [Mangrovimonas aestuarii]|uniref:fibronectin type III domain-containing protein n=1 Tax=Mangrovimonas aestuarii TaxID=3018443 RepID=UPI002379A160
MRKTTFWLIATMCFVFSWQSQAQFTFPVIAGPTNVPGSTEITLNINDVANTAAVTAGVYDSFLITVDWVNVNNAYSSEADVTVTTAAGSVVIDPPTSGGANNTNSATLTFQGDLAGLYEPAVDGALDLILDQSWTNSDCNWLNIAVTLYEAPTCIEPNTLGASNVLTTSVDLTWAQGFSETMWNIEWGVAGFVQGSGTMVSGLTSTTYNENTLSPSTTYEFYVQADCGAGDTSAWAGPFEFTTDCAAYTPEYLQDFATIIPQCWDEADNGDPTTGPTGLGAGSWIADGFANNGTNGAYKINLFTTGKSDWVLTPSFDLSTGGPYQVEFDFAIMQYASSTTAGTLGTDDQVQFLISTDAGTTWTALDTWSNTSVVPAGGTHYIYDLTSYAGMTARFAYWGSEGTVDDPEDIDVSFDNFRIRDIPSCPEPFALTATNIGSTSAELSWTESGSATSWNIEVVTTGTAPTGTPTYTGVTNPYSVTDLSPVTDYEFYVQSDCGSGDTSVWVGPFGFTTACSVFLAPFTEPFTGGTTPNCWTEGGDNAWDYNLNAGYAATDVDDHTVGGGTNYAWMDGSDNGNAEISTLTSPLVDVSGLTSPSLQFALFSNNTNNATINLIDVELYDGTAWNTVMNITNLLGAEWQDYFIDLSTYTISGPVQVRFTVTGTSTSAYYNDILLDDVSFDEMPACAQPFNLMASAVTDTTANLSWTEAGTATSWNIEMVTAGTVPTGTPTYTGVTNPYTVTGLTPATEYEFYVQADCGAGDTSAWVGPVSITTECAAYIPEYLEDFTTIIPQCWDEADNGDPTTGPTGLGAGSWIADGFANNGTNGAYKINIYTTGKSDWVLSPSFDLSTGGPYQVEFDFAIMQYASSTTVGTLGSDDEVQFLISTDAGTTWTALDTWDNTSVVPAGGTHYVYDLTSY